MRESQLVKAKVEESEKVEQRIRSHAAEILGIMSGLSKEGKAKLEQRLQEALKELRNGAIPRAAKVE